MVAIKNTLRAKGPIILGAGGVSFSVIRGIIDYSSIMEIAYHMSQVDTFIPKLYLSVRNFFNKLLENEQLAEIHDEIKKYKSYFETTHAKRKLIF